MRPLSTDLSIFEKFKFDAKPVGVNFLHDKPEGINKLDKKLGLCEMVKEARKTDSCFYMQADNEDCAGHFVLGMTDTPVFAEFGKIGPALGMFQDERANGRMYNELPKFKKGVVNYAVFAPLGKMILEPDVLVLTADVRQAEIVLRAMSYTTGELWESKSASVLSCAYLLVYPYKSGKVNYQVEGMGFGKIARGIKGEGMVNISIPWEKLPIILNSLKEMEWVLPSYTCGREKYLQTFGENIERIVREEAEIS
ncbi:DUF169 domain-containing protein [Desulfobacula phenolica]|uniref:Uncharacterized conserved protein, DUF169 family n=1 Tax=Desulfobacula phenolica TaxID=90732 RepID=A0A1H2KE47_9BACT|nr:DUF169 domain-containing protein [Desulfobacula phenolica]SDU66987.1 Uncharacterized conserved protein, DUF169 family [Desulfobacula phenolica]